jgi:hypothetical protein
MIVRTYASRLSARRARGQYAKSFVTVTCTRSSATCSSWQSRKATRRSQVSRASTYATYSAYSASRRTLTRDRPR